jgi:hypothetical protein
MQLRYSRFRACAARTSVPADPHFLHGSCHTFGTDVHGRMCAHCHAEWLLQRRDRDIFAWSVVHVNARVPGSCDVSTCTGVRVDMVMITLSTVCDEV